MTAAVHPADQASRRSSRSAWLRTLPVLALLLFAQLVQAATQVEAVRVWRAPDHTRVVLDLSARPDFKLFTLDNPARVVVDLSSTRLATDLGAVDLQGSPVDKLRGAARSGGDFRLVMDLQRNARPKAFILPANKQYGNRLVIDLFEQQRPRVIKTATDNLGKRDLVIAIDAGHGGEDPGAIGPRKIREKKVVMAISRELQKLIDRTQGYRAVMIRDGDYYIGLKQRRQLARDAQADLFLSIHADAFKDKRVSGGSVYTLSQRGASSASARFLADAENKSDRIGGVDLSDKDDLLASVLLDLSMTATLESSSTVAKSILGEMGHVSKLHKRTVEHAGFAVLKSPDIPSVLIETGFISNPKEARRLANTTHQKELAMAIFEGVVEYFDRNAVEGTWVHWNRHNGGKPVRLAGRSEKSYKIKYGDTLSEVAQRHSISVAELRRYNKLRNDKIHVGQVIRIPAS